jgi:hypothetical protein
MRQLREQKMVLNGDLDFSDPWSEVLGVQMKAKRILTGS